MNVFNRQKVEIELVPKPDKGKWIFGMFKENAPFVGTIEDDRLDWTGYCDGVVIMDRVKWKDIVDEIEYWGYFPE